METGATPLIATAGTLAPILIVHVALSVVGIGWGLPSRDIDPYLFGQAESWSGEKIARLAGTGEKASPTRGADVDVDPLDKTAGPVPLTGTDERAAAIYLRYRLYTHQPDEMIAMMALAHMRPAALDFDPRLYQYGGLFIYPVGALIRLCGTFGLIDVRSDLTFYLDRPGEFGKFYVVARAYSALWGMVAVVAVYLIARRLGNRRSGLVAALLLTLLPVVVCMSHEGKPHLPGAALMLLAVWLAMRYADSSKRRDWLAMCVACGAALGMVLSSLPIFVLIPLLEVTRTTGGRAVWKAAAKRTAGGLALAAAVYAVTNPYVPIDLFVNRDVLRSNFGNSLAMYEIDRLGEGLLRMASLTIEGATLPVLLVGMGAMILLVHRKRWSVAPLAVPAGLIFVQFALIAAGKPAEYGRFGIFADATLVVATACAATPPRRRYRGGLTWAAAVIVVGWVGLSGAYYLCNFAADAGTHGTRRLAARQLALSGGAIAVLAEPAPYCCPPMDFAARDVWLFPSAEAWADRSATAAGPQILMATMDHPPMPRRASAPSADWRPIPDSPPNLPLSPISWANKPIYVRRRVRLSRIAR